MGRKSRRDARVEGEGRGSRRFAVGFFLALFLLLGGLYAAGYALAGDRVPRDVSVAGVDIGGLRPQQARATLSRELAAREDEPILARDGSDTYRVVPSEAGLRVDVAATVEQAGGGPSLDPLRMVQVLVGGEDVAPVVDVDQSRLSETVDDIAERVRRAPVEGEITFRGGRARPAYPTPGRELDRAATERALADVFLASDRDIDLPVRRLRTKVTNRDVDVARTGFARRAMSSGVTLRVSGKTARLSPGQLGAGLSMRPRHGRLVPRMDAATLSRRASSTLATLTRRPRPATVEIRNGEPRVVRGRPGTTLDERRLARKVLRALRKRGDARVVRMRPSPLAPDFGVRQARRLGVKEVVSRFTTDFPHSSYRNTNLGRAAEKIDGTLLRPGDVFSLNRIVGKRTARNGFAKGFIIDDGVLVEDFGGGVSQVATTTYNAAFFAGLKDVEHHPHSLYFDRYPMGREATVAWGSLDLRFENDTRYGVLVQAWIVPSTPSSDGEMHVRLWSTENRRVRAGLSDQYAFTEPKVRYDTSGDCVAQTGFQGFQVDVFRYFFKGGTRVRTEKDHVRYDAADTVRCRAEPSQGSRSGGGAPRGRP